jgi:hypothetical protein
LPGRKADIAEVLANSRSVPADRGRRRHRLAQTLLLRKKRACMARQYLPGLSQRHAAGMTLQQRNTDLCLQLAHSFAGGGQGQMGHGGPTGNTAAIHDGDKQSQIGQIHRITPSPPFGFPVVLGQHTALWL